MLPNAHAHVKCYSARDACRTADTAVPQCLVVAHPPLLGVAVQADGLVLSQSTRAFAHYAALHCVLAATRQGTSQLAWACTVTMTGRQCQGNYVSSVMLQFD